MRERKMRREFLPKLFIIKISNKCNMRCAYCYSKRSNNELSEGALEHIAELIASWIRKRKLKKVKIGFLGGEPLLDRDKIEFFITKLNSIIDKNEKVIEYAIQTNGTIITREIIEWIKERKIKIGISLDGPKEINDAARKLVDGEGSYELVRKNIRKLIEAEIEPKIITVINKNDWNKVREVINNFIELGIMEFRLNPILPVNSEAKKLEITPEQYYQAMKEAVETIIELRTKGIKTIERTTLSYISMLKGKTNNICLRKPCGAGIDMLVFNNDEAIYPCDMIIQEEFRIAWINEISDLSELERNKTIIKHALGNYTFR